MVLTFFAVEPCHIDGTEYSPALHSSPITSTPPGSTILIWRLVCTKPLTSPYLSLDNSQVVAALSTLFPQLSTSCSAGPDLDRIVACLARTETFTLFLAVENITSNASVSSNIVGCLTLITLKLLMNSRAHIEDLVVSSTCRGQGVGRGLMKRAIKEAVEVAGCSMVDLTSKPDRIQARTLYESLGFQIRDTGAFRYYAPKKSLIP